MEMGAQTDDAVAPRGPDLGLCHFTERSRKLLAHRLTCDSRAISGAVASANRVIVDTVAR